MTEAGKRRLLARLRAENLAAWCLLTGQSPETYLSLTNLQRTAFIDVAMRFRRR